MGKIARLTNDGTFQIKGEIIEYPAELEGGRNLLPINTVGRYTGGRIYNSSQFNTDDPYAFETNGNPTNKIGFVGYNLIPERTMVLSAESDRVEDMKFSIGWYDSVGGYISHGDIGVSNTYVIGDRIFYITTVPKDAYQISVGIGEWPYKTDYTIKKPQLILGNKATDWTPAPEDLDLVYPDDIQYFATGFRNNGDLFVGDLIEVDVEKQSKNHVRNGNYEYGEIEPWILYNGAQLSWNEGVGAYLFQGGADSLAYQELTLEPHTAYTLSLIRQRQYGITSVRILRSLEAQDYIADITLTGTSLTPTSTTFLTEGQTQYYISFTSTGASRRGYAREIQLEKGDIATEYSSYGEVWVEEDFPLMRFKDGKLYIKGVLMENQIL